MTENVTGVFGFNGRSMIAPWTRICSTNGEDTIRIMGSAAEWHDLMDQMNRYYHPHPPVDDTGDVPVAPNPDMIRIDDIRKVQDGDLVHVKGVREPMECAVVDDDWSGDPKGTSLEESRIFLRPEWGALANLVHCGAWLQNARFDYAERPKPVPTLPSFPDDDYSFHFFIGADGTKFAYKKAGVYDAAPWLDSVYEWLGSEGFVKRHPEALPFTEVTPDMVLGTEEQK